MTTVTAAITYNKLERTAYKNQLNLLKEAQKERALEIRRLKSTRKKVPFGRVPGLESDQREYRHFHIAYSELRGRTREQIEAKCDNPPNEYMIEKIKKGIITAYENAYVALLEAEDE